MGHTGDTVKRTPVYGNCVNSYVEESLDIPGTGGGQRMTPESLRIRYKLNITYRCPVADITVAGQNMLSAKDNLNSQMYLRTRENKYHNIPYLMQGDGFVKF